MAKTRFGVFSLSQFPDLSKVVESFDDDLGFFELAEQLGYDKVWIAEHLFSTDGLVTSTQVYAAAIAQRTKKIRIGMAVCAIPFNHPLRTASDFALVDILSHGRLDFGVGRAYPAARIHWPRGADGEEPGDARRRPRHPAQGLDATEAVLSRQILDHTGTRRGIAQARTKTAPAGLSGNHQPRKLRAGRARPSAPLDGLALHLPNLSPAVDG
jgi:alkanesulfonate monooxygenase SsuD/methylene tetrahydromethanopterin reductase-like flavin-dependent oxidoreductase (luciferase family)